VIAGLIDCQVLNASVLRRCVRVAAPD